MSDALEKRIKKHIIGKPHRFLAVAPLGFEQTLINELNLILRENVIEQPHITGDGKIEFTAKITEAWKAVASSRIANHVLMEITNFKAENFREFEKKSSEIPWELYLDERRKFPVEAGNDKKSERGNSSSSINIHVTCKHSRLYHSDAIAERLQKVIGEECIGETDHNASPQNLYVNFLDDRCTIWQDLAGEELYKRGFERFVNDAPLKETIAAAMLFEAICMATAPQTSKSEAQPHDSQFVTVFDLMSGSGTFSLEAAFMANKIIPGKCRDFALKHQPAFKEATWNYLLGNSFQVTGFRDFITSDISERSIEIIKHNVECAPIPAGIINPQNRDFFTYTAKEIADTCGDASPILVLNPPYGKRLDFDAPKLYTKIGRKLTELAHDLSHLGKALTVAILAPKDDSREFSKYTCTTNLLRECPELAQKQSPDVKIIETSHGGFSLNAIIAKLG